MNVGASDKKPRWEDATPQASALIESLRDIGYSFETAIADIIDNSITAGASLISILTETSADSPFLAIVDDGHGMSEEELISAMRPGSANPLDSRDAPDLGRFGLGLKSASFSQCRRLTVVSRRSGTSAVAIWDLDTVAQRNEWQVEIRADDTGIPAVEHLGGNGTLVLWQKLDRLMGGYAKDGCRRATAANRTIAAAERHLRLVFHRFMSGPNPIAIKLNGRLLPPLDPFAQNHPATISDPRELLVLPRGTVEIQSFTLPHHKQMDKREWDDIGGPEGHLKTQGFYLYRCNRLILYGTWLGLCRQSELTKLARVCINIPNSMDSDLKIDVKKSSAQLPAVVRDRLKNIIERIQTGSKRTYQHRGRKLVDEERLPIWHRILADGRIRYQLNTEHPAFSAYVNDLPEDKRQGFLSCLALAGASLPVETLHADLAAEAEQVTPDRMNEEALEQVVKFTVSTLLSLGRDVDEILQLLRDVDPFRSAWNDTVQLVRQFAVKEDF